MDRRPAGPNRCFVCHRVLSCQSALKMHYRTHTGERPFQCHVCGRAFSTKGNLKAHYSVHKGVAAAAAVMPNGGGASLPGGSSREKNGNGALGFHPERRSQASAEPAAAAGLKRLRSERLEEQLSKRLAVAAAAAASSPRHRVEQRRPLTSPNGDGQRPRGGDEAESEADAPDRRQDPRSGSDGDNDIGDGSSPNGSGAPLLPAPPPPPLAPPPLCPSTLPAIVSQLVALQRQQVQQLRLIDEIREQIVLIAPHASFTARGGKRPRPTAGGPSPGAQQLCRDFDGGDEPPLPSIPSGPASPPAASSSSPRRNANASPFGADPIGLRSHLRGTSAAGGTATRSMAASQPVATDDFADGRLSPESAPRIKVKSEAFGGDGAPESRSGSGERRALGNRQAGRAGLGSRLRGHGEALTRLGHDPRVGFPERPRIPFGATFSGDEDAAAAMLAASSSSMSGFGGDPASLSSRLVGARASWRRGPRGREPHAVPFGYEGPGGGDAAGDAGRPPRAPETSKLQQLVERMDRRPAEPNRCFVCHRVLSCQSALKMHYRTHTGERPFQCRVCGRAFSTKGNLKAHYSVHKGVAAAAAAAAAVMPNGGEGGGGSPDAEAEGGAGGDEEDEEVEEVEEEEEEGGGGAADRDDWTSEYGSSDAGDHDGWRAPAARWPSPESPAPRTTGVGPEPRERPRGHGGSGTASPPSPPGDRASESSVASASPPSPRDAGPEPRVEAGAGGAEGSRPGSGGRPAFAGRDRERARCVACLACGKTFSCQSALEIHHRSHTKERPFLCTYCGRGFSTKGNLKQHLMTHRADLPADAVALFAAGGAEPGCFPPISAFGGAGEARTAPAAGVGERPSLVASSHGIPPAGCPSSPTAAAAGRRSHKQRDCPTCGKAFSSSSALQIHERTHTGERPFACSVCGRAFTTKGNLKVHMGTHVWSNSTVTRRGRRVSLEGPLLLLSGLPPTSSALPSGIPVGSFGGAGGHTNLALWPDHRRSTNAAVILNAATVTVAPPFTRAAVAHGGGGDPLITCA
uniref:Sal-like protein 4 n=1 Tax=Petromyzon marinus TaxID=7757 RepID=A0AAJ7UDK0_PETMA|nr:sal-like protein 4 [Petromyzon marinus]